MAAVLLGCGSPSVETGTSTAKGLYLVSYLVNVSPPSGGTVTSDDGQIRCGTSGSACFGRYAWSTTAVLRAVPDAGYGFQAWGGDCQLTGPCSLDTKTNGSDKTVVAVFALVGQVGHGNWTSPAIHGPGYFDFLANVPGALTCNSAACHGATLAGAGAAPPCQNCHVNVGWTGWQTNCSFCHGARTAASKAGYAVAAHPDWSAPPDAISQRLTGTASPDRTGAHQAHLVGTAGDGISYALPFACGTCHTVPSNLSHVDGANARAIVTLVSAGQASLPPSLGTYDPTTGTCATYCHGTAASPAWSGSVTCGTCHGVPPSNHGSMPRTACYACHPGTMNQDGTLDVAGGKHVDGVVEAAGGHTDISSPALHGPRFFDFIAGAPGALACTVCHGANYEGGVGPSCTACHATAGWTSWRTNCSFCHGTRNSTTQVGYDVSAFPTFSAPPDDIAGRLTGQNTPDRTGAHQAHLAGQGSDGQRFALPFACNTCHSVPADLTHISGSGARAAVALNGTGQAGLPAALGTYDSSAGTCAAYCHGASSTPRWSGAPVQCGSCHAVPPASHGTIPLTACAGCHPGTMKADGTLDVAGGKHVDGIIEASGGHTDISSPALHGPRFFDFIAGVPGALGCTVCHGQDYNGGVGPSCDACHATAGWTGWRTNCSFCHGARNPATQAGYDITAHPSWSAPPDALSQRLTGTPAPARTGAHQAHLAGQGSDGQSFALPFTCATCHVVPADLSHIDGASARAVVALVGAGQASLPATMGTYDATAGSCSTYCHGTSSPPTWSGAPMQCGACHAVPPSNHGTIAITACSGCHPDTMNGDGTLNVAGGKHLNGVIDASGGHADITSPAQHGPMALDFLGGVAGALNCKGCHGQDFGGGGFAPSCTACHISNGWTSWQANCSFCHGARTAVTRVGYDLAAHPEWSAPPDAVSQRLTGVAAPLRTGAHQVHLTGIASDGISYAPRFQCATCHAVPADLSHVRGSTARATVTLAGAGQASLPPTLGSYDPSSGSCATYCHGATIQTSTGSTAPPPAWNGTTPTCADGCHGAPPPTGRIITYVNQIVGTAVTAPAHVIHAYWEGIYCGDCHKLTATSDYFFDPLTLLSDTTRHVNGQVDVSFSSAASPGTWDPATGSCTSLCHSTTRARTWR